MTHLLPFKRRLSLFAIILSFASWIANAQTRTAEDINISINTLSSQLLFDNPTNPGFFRIPAITKLKNGDILALCDNRTTGPGDIGTGAHIRIMQKLGTLTQDHTYSWTDHSIAINYDETSTHGFNFAHGDAAIVTDRKSGCSLMLAASGTTWYPSGGCDIGLYRSDKNGMNWSGQNFTEKIKKVRPASVTCMFFTSGRIIQSKKIKRGSHYRIYSAMCTNAGSVVMYSDNFGDEWHCLGDTIAYHGGDETALEELPNGDILLSARLVGRNGRGFSVYSYDKGFKTGTWSERITSSSMNDVANCNGELLLVPTRYKNKYVILQSVAMSGRKDVSIFYKLIDTKKDNYSLPTFYEEWDGCKQISNSLSAYSTMVLDKESNVAFLYEENSDPEHDGTDAYDIVFKYLSVDVKINK